MKSFNMKNYNIKNFKRITCGCLTAAVLATTLAAAPVTAKAAAPKLNKTSATMTVGKKMTLKVQNVNKDTAVKWSTTKKTVAAVSAKGVVTAKAEGKATIKAVVSNKTLKCKITVTDVAAEAPSTDTSSGKDTNTDAKDVSALLAGKSYKGTAATPLGNIDVLMITFGSDGTATGTQMNQATMQPEEFTGTYKAVLSGKKVTITVGSGDKSLTEELTAENDELTKLSATKKIAGMDVQITVEEVKGE
ncbi:MAG: Ig-like domain-containing protein [Eubacterium sp.]|nr:Ig-like domain-containing protein [Eubacterium sp.]